MDLIEEDKAKAEQAEQAKANPACAHCSKPEPVSRCAQCKTKYYCSRDCQKADWKTHRLVCGSNPGSKPGAKPGSNPGSIVGPNPGPNLKSILESVLEPNYKPNPNPNTLEEFIEFAILTEHTYGFQAMRRMNGYLELSPKRKKLVEQLTLDLASKADWNELYELFKAEREYDPTTILGGIDLIGGGKFLDQYFFPLVFEFVKQGGADLGPGHDFGLNPIQVLTQLVEVGFGNGNVLKLLKSKLQNMGLLTQTKIIGIDPEIYQYRFAQGQKMSSHRSDFSDCAKWKANAIKKGTWAPDLVWMWIFYPEPDNYTPDSKPGWDLEAIKSVMPAMVTLFVDKSGKAGSKLLLNWLRTQSDYVVISSKDLRFGFVFLVWVC